MLNEVIRTMRKRRGLTQEQLAEYLGISVMTVRRWEWGERTPDAAQIQKISQVLGVSISELMGEEKTDSEKKTVKQGIFPSLAYWGEVADNARKAVNDGQNLGLIYSLLADATSTVKLALGNGVATA